MSKRKTQLTAQEVKGALPKINPKGQVTEKPYKLTDSHGLYLLVMPNGTKHWRWKFRFRDGTGTLKERQASFGSYPEVSLAKARERMEDARKLVRQGIDPIKAKQPEVKPETQTFRLVAEQFIEANKAGWKNEKHKAQWTSTLKTYAYPEIGELAVGDITLAHIVKILKPIWTSKPETAVRVRGRIENVLDYAEVQGWRSGKNPALWKGNLKHALPSSGKLKKVKHFAALDWQEVSAFMAKLRNQPGDGAKALEFLILTAARSGEVRGARWNEIDLVNKLWTIPGDRMKAGEEHRVPLSDAAHAVLGAMLPRKRSDTGLVFPGQKRGAMLSDMTLSAVLRRMKLDEITVHGFRSTFRDWCAEETNYPRDIAEMALAHTIGSKVEAAYRRGDMLEKRRSLMVDWAGYCAGQDSLALAASA